MKAEKLKSKQKSLNAWIMKKITLLAICFLAGSWVTAQVATAHDSQRRGHVASIHFDEPIVFMERGIEFYVFHNGDFDFNTRPFDTQTSFIYRRGNSARANVAINYGVRIDHDAFGRVRRVGNTFINYDGFNRVNRIGTVFIRYNQFGLAQVGGMHFVYNRRGALVSVHGFVNGVRHQSAVAVGHGTYYGPVTTVTHTTTHSGSFYYRTDGTRVNMNE